MAVLHWVCLLYTE